MKQKIENDELTWLVRQQVNATLETEKAISVAVAPCDKHDWIILTPRRGRLTERHYKLIEAVQARMRQRYTLIR